MSKPSIDVSGVRAWYMAPSMQHLHLNMTDSIYYHTITIPHMFWEKRTSLYDRSNEGMVRRYQQSAQIEFTVYGAKYDAAAGGVILIFAIESSKRKYRSCVRDRTIPWHSDEWCTDQPARESLIQLMSTVECAYHDLPPFKGVAFTVKQWSEQQYHMELTCQWPLAPSPPPTDLNLYIKSNYSSDDHWRTISIASAVHSHATAGLCLHNRPSRMGSYNASSSHIFDWISYHLYLGFNPIMISDGWVNNQTIRALLQPYI